MEPRSPWLDFIHANHLSRAQTFNQSREVYIFSRLSETLMASGTAPIWEITAVDALVQALSGCLTERQATNQIKRAPDGFDKAVKLLKSSNNTSRAFQAAGFWAWLAYFLATSRNNEIEQSLSQLPSPTLQHVVTEVSGVEADTSLVTRIQHTLHVCNRAVTRRSESAWCLFPPRIL